MKIEVMKIEVVYKDQMRSIEFFTYDELRT